MIGGRIEAVLSDVDGVLTPNLLVFSGDDEIAKTFHVRDGHGTMLLRRAGIVVALVTGRDDAAMRRRADTLGLAWHIARAGNDKGKIVRQLARAQRFDLARTVFIGDDTTDLAAFAQVGWPVAVADAEGPIRAAARRVTRNAGGAGAYREVVDWVLAAEARYNNR